MSDLVRMAKMDRNALSVVSLFDPADERAFWHSKTPRERLAAMELLRNQLWLRFCFRPTSKSSCSCSTRRELMTWNSYRERRMTFG